ncbi:MAG: Rho termination factor N-terminal domain-containing protein [Candidatus Sigynarchaeota archaeon]
MNSRAELESKTVPELKKICKDCDVKGYSKLTKEALIAAILEKQGQAPSLEQSLAQSGSTLAPDPATEQFLQRTRTKVVFSRDESETRIEKNKGLVARRAEVSGVPSEKAIDSEAGAQLVKATTGKSMPKQKASGVIGSASDTAGGSQVNLASTLSAARESSTRASSAGPAPAMAKKEKLVVQSSQIQKVGASKSSVNIDSNVAAVNQVPGKSALASPAPASTASPELPVQPSPAPASAVKKDKKVVKADQVQKAVEPEKSLKKNASEAKTKPAALQPEPTTKGADKKTSKMVVSTQQIQRVAPVVPSEPQEKRFQDLPLEDQHRALKAVSKNVQSLLKMRKPDLMKKKSKDLEKYLEMLEVEKGRFTVYRPTEKALRGLMDESITLINQVKEEQLNQLEQKYLTQDLPKVIKKNEDKIKKIVARVDRYYTDMDAARDIVEKFIKKAPFPASYLMTVIAQKIRDKTL